MILFKPIHHPVPRGKSMHLLITQYWKPNSVSKVIAMTGVGHRLEDQHSADHLPILKVEKEWHRVNTNSLK